MALRLYIRDWFARKARRSRMCFSCHHLNPWPKRQQQGLVCEGCGYTWSRDAMVEEFIATFDTTWPMNVIAVLLILATVFTLGIVLGQTLIDLWWPR